MKPFFILSQAATFLVCLASSIDVVVDSLQVTVIHLPVLHHLNKVIEIIPGVQQDSHLSGSAKMHGDLLSCTQPGDLVLRLELHQEGSVWWVYVGMDTDGTRNSEFPLAKGTWQTGQLFSACLICNIYSFYICEMFQTFISKIAGTEWVALPAKGKISKPPKKWFIGCKSLTIMNVIPSNKFFIVIT